MIVKFKQKHSFLWQRERCPCAQHGHKQAVEAQHHTFLTSVLRATAWSTTRRSRATHGRAPPWRSELEGAGWGPVPLWMIWRGDILLSLSGIETPLPIP